MICAEIWGYQGDLDAQLSQLLLTGCSLASQDCVSLVRKVSARSTRHFSIPETQLLACTVEFPWPSGRPYSAITLRQEENKEHNVKNKKKILSLTFSSVLCHCDYFCFPPEFLFPLDREKKVNQPPTEVCLDLAVLESSWSSNFT